MFIRSSDICFTHPNQGKHHAYRKSRSRQSPAEPDQPHPDHDRPSATDGLRHQVHRSGGAAYNAALAAKAAKEFKVATILTTVAEKSFSGPIFEEIKNVFPDEHIIDRTTMNTWEDGRIAEVVNARRTASCWPACGLRCASSVRPSRRWNRVLEAGDRRCLRRRV
jgi:hypothetical protein